MICFITIWGYTLWSNSSTEKEDGDSAVKRLMCDHTPP